jgi:hypothetical protein
MSPQTFQARRGGRMLENLWIYEIIVKNQIGSGEARLPSQGQQRRIAGSGPH